MKILPNSIITFHAISDPKWMNSVLQLLQSNFNMVSLEQIIQYYYKNLNLKNACHITFDDGDLSFYNNVFPLLKKYNIPASIYVSPKIIKNGENFWFQEIRGYDQDFLRKIILESEQKPIFNNMKYPLISILKTMKIQDINKYIDKYKKLTYTPDKPSLNMGVDHILELHKSGLITIGAHTLNHPILKNETNEVSEKEIKESVTELSELLNTNIINFAYPNGTPELDFNIREMNYLEEAGIKISFTTKNNSFSRKDNTFSIPRKGITYGNQQFILAKLILGNTWALIKKIYKGKNENDFRIEIEKSH